MPKKVKTSDDRYDLFNQTLLIEWKPEYNLGIPIIDEQHRGIVTTINSFYFGMQNNHGANLLRPVIGMIKEYTRIHFEIEEDFLRKYKYPGLERHHELHYDLIQELTKVGKESLLSQDPDKFMKFLRKWWIDHICEEDRLFLDYLLATLR